ncbi:MAG: helicase HerA-like domain-containing protein [Geminicoccaceae bacterium]
MENDPSLLIGKGETPQRLLLRLANRHGLITGATGTGKTITLQILAEAFSRAGVPVFCADVKGDLSGIAMAGEPNPKLEARAAELGDTDYACAATPAVFWDLFGEQGHPVRATISEMGPLLLARLMELNEVQEGVLTIAFRVADDEGLLLLDLKDLRSILVFLADNADAVAKTYGNVSKSSIGAIQRRLLVLEEEGADKFFGEPALTLGDLMRTDDAGRGIVNVLMADRLMRSPRLYGTFLLWLLSELFETLPELGDPEKPVLVFFFDEAHLLFDNSPRALLEKVEQVVRLIRSKGVGVYFVTQNPIDVPPVVLGQLGNRIQHALRAFTPRDQKAVKVAAETFRANPAFSTEEVITALGVGEALVSTLMNKGEPSMVERTKILPPRSRMGPLTSDERQGLIDRSPLFGRYEDAVDRESASEMLQQRAADQAREAAAAEIDAAIARQHEFGEELGSSRRVGSKGRKPAPEQSSGGILGDIFTGGGGRRQSPAEAMTKSMARTIGSQLGRTLVRGILGSLMKGR